MPMASIMIAWEVKTAAQAVQAGLNRSVPIWPDHYPKYNRAGPAAERLSGNGMPGIILFKTTIRLKITMEW
jgi:hypothetical protein